MMRNLRKGFTVIEVLIVVVIMTVIMVAISLSASAAKSTARATKIINDMHTWKQAALEWMGDHYEELDLTQPSCLRSGEQRNDSGQKTDADKSDNLYYQGQALISLLGEYVDNYDPQVISGNGSNRFKIKCQYHRWFVCYDLPQDPTMIKKLMTKLSSRAKEVGLFKNIDKPAMKDLKPYDGVNTWLYLMIIDFNR